MLSICFDAAKPSLGRSACSPLEDLQANSDGGQVTVLGKGRRHPGCQDPCFRLETRERPARCQRGAR